MIYKKLIVFFLFCILVSCQPLAPTNLTDTSLIDKTQVTNPVATPTDPKIYIDHVDIRDLFEGAVLIGKYDTLQYYGSPHEAYSLLCCRMVERIGQEEYTRHAGWISQFELVTLYPLSLDLNSPLKLNNMDIINGNLVFIRKMRAWETKDSLLAIENGKTYINYLILSKTDEGWRIAEINTAYPTEKLVEDSLTEKTDEQLSSSPDAYLRYLANQTDTYLSLARVSSFVTQADLILQGKLKDSSISDQETQSLLVKFLDLIDHPNRLFIEKLMPVADIGNDSGVVSQNTQERVIVIEATLSSNDHSSVFYFTLGESEDGYRIKKIEQGSVPLP
jgi:hypothetical protein